MENCSVNSRYIFMQFYWLLTNSQPIRMLNTIASLFYAENFPCKIRPSILLDVPKLGGLVDGVAEHGVAQDVNDVVDFFVSQFGLKKMKQTRCVNTKNKQQF